MKTQKKLFYLFTILTFSTSFLTVTAQNFNPPESLRLSEWCYNYNFVWADPDSTTAVFQHFNIYKDDVLIDSTLLNYCTVEFENGSHIFGVSAVYDGGESSILSRDLEAPVGKTPNSFLITSSDNYIILSWWSPGYFSSLTYMNNYSGSGYYPSNFGLSDSVTYAIKSNWPSQDEDLVREFTSFEFMPGIFYGNGALDFHFKIFQGDSLPQLIYFKDLDNIQNNQMNNVIIDPPLIIDNHENIMLAVTLINDSGNIGSMMVDDFIPDPGYGNLMSKDDSTWFQSYEEGDWVMNGLFTYALWFEDRNPNQTREINEGIVNQYDIYRDGVYLTSTFESRVIDSNFTEADCGKYFEYYVTATYPTCTSSPSDTVGISLECSSSLNDLPAGNSIRIYPNPAYKVLNIESDDPIEKLTLTDLYGHEILTPLGKAGKINQIEISNLNSGVYLLKIMSNGLSYSEKVIVMPPSH